MLTVTHFQRKPEPAYFSIEAVFRSVRRSAPPDLAITTYTLPFLSRGLLRRLASAVAARRHQASVNHIVGDVTFLAGVLDPRRTLTTFHDCRVLDMMPPGLRRSIVRRLWYEIPARRSRLVTCVSPWTRDELVRHGVVAQDDPRVHVVPNPLTVPVAAPLTPAPGAPRILVVGTTSSKNVPRILRAVARLSPRPAVDVVGSPSGLATLAAGLGVDCTFHGIVDDDLLRHLYSVSTVLAFLSTSEGFGLPIIEAQAAGLPVVTSDLEPHRWVAGGAAALADPGDVGAMAAALSRVLDSAPERARLRELGGANIRRFSPEAAAEAYADLYRRVAA